MYLLLSVVLFCSSCASFSAAIAPEDVKNGVAIHAAVAQLAVEYPPVGDDLRAYLEANAEAWLVVAIYFGVAEREQSNDAE